MALLFSRFLVCPPPQHFASSYLSLPSSDDLWLLLHCCATRPMRASKRLSKHSRSPGRESSRPLSPLLWDGRPKNLTSQTLGCPECCLAESGP